MKLTAGILYFILISAACSFSYGQMQQFKYKRKITGIPGQWNKIILPDEIYGKTLQNLSDIRIFGITVDNDTIEAPYVLRLTNEKITENEIEFKTLNASHNEKGYYFTFEIQNNEPVNQIKLTLEQQNFDWRVTLEGSQDQNEWFKLLENYRIVSIKNDWTDFQFTNLSFPSSKYRFFRLLIDSNEKPELTVASIAQYEITDGVFKNYPIKTIGTKENKKLKQSEIDVALQLPVRACRIKIGVADTFDYYRPITIKYLADSFQTEQGWKYNYRTLISRTLNSMEENEFKFNSTTLQKLKIIIYNDDNQVLTVDSIKAEGYIHELVVRFTEAATYFLTYGNNNAGKPQYDIKRFEDRIPGNLTTLDLDDEQSIEKPEKTKANPIFKNKAWLWAIMTAMILLLGWFSVKMIRKN